MVLPFLMGLISILMAIKGRRPASLWMWGATLVIYLAWCNHHMNDPLQLVF